MSAGDADGRPADVEWDGHVRTVTELSQALAHLQDRPDGRPLPVAGVLNLIAVPHRDEADETERVIEALADHQPSRAIVVALDPDGEGIDAHLEARAQLVQGHSTVLVELVRLTLRGTATGGAASAVVPLLRADLPVFLWWPGTPDPENPVLTDLLGTADRLVTEAGRADDAIAGLDCLLRTVRASGPAVTDLAWAALTPWRQVMVQLIDAENLARLRTGGVVEIWHPGERPTAEALLMAGWLRDIAGDAFLIELHRRPDVAEGGLCAVHVENTEGRRLSIERLPGRPSAAVTVSSPREQGRRRVLPLPLPTRAGLLAGELEVQRHDLPFERALPHAATVSG